MRPRDTLPLAALTALLAAVPAAAQTVVVTPSNTQGWTASANTGSSTGITAANPRGAGTGSLAMGGTAGASAIRTRYDLYAPNVVAGGSFGLLSNLQSFGFDYFKSSSSTVSGIQGPAFRLFVTSSDQPGRVSELIWEYTYQAPGTNVPTDAWQTVTTSLTAGTFWRFTQFSGSRGPQAADCSYTPANPKPVYQQISAFLSSGCIASDAQVIGVSVGLGSIPGPAGQTYAGNADLIRLQFAGQSQATVYDFETAVVPEPSTWALLGTGLVALGGAAARRRRAV